MAEKFIEVTDVTRGKVSVNPAHITTVYADKPSGGTTINLIGIDQSLLVVESYVEVAALAEAARA